MPRRGGRTPGREWRPRGKDCAKPERADICPPRLGPRPLALHLASARRILLDAGDGADDDFRDFVRGLRAYWRHPYRREAEARPVLWARGSTRLLDYGAGGGGHPVIAVPSLINRAYILDLLPERSLLGHLAGAGLRPLLLDWGEPGAEERRLRLEDLVLERLGGALDHARGLGAGRPSLLGYCMGGLLALALTVNRPRDVAGLALLATPWDFRGYELDVDAFGALVGTPASALAGHLGGLPVDAVQAWFASIDPARVARKFVRFARLPPASAEARLFVAVEDWLNDGVTLGAEVAAECLRDWYGANRPGRGVWRVGGRAVRPEALACPGLVAIPAGDRIVPPRAAEPLARSLPDATVLRPAGGHIGMVVGTRSERDLWRPLAAWLRRIAALQE